MTIHALQVRKDDIGAARVVADPSRKLADGAVRLAVERFALTANNVTYAKLGDTFSYWDFFPAAAPWGIVPAWGVARVQVSNHPDVAVGERVFGFVPMASGFDVLPTSIAAASFLDGAAHRMPMHALYNRYERLDGAREDRDAMAAKMLFQPLFATAFLIERMFRGRGWDGARRIVVTSASAKTALALAANVGRGSPGVERIGLTSPANFDFVLRSGLYEQVLAYEDAGSVAGKPAVLVDVAGAPTVRQAIHEALGPDLRYSCMVGATHSVPDDVPARLLPGPKPTLFFAPSVAREAVSEIGPDAYATELARAWRDLLPHLSGLVRIVEAAGLEHAAEQFRGVLRGAAPPDAGIVITL